MGMVIAAQLLKIDFFERNQTTENFLRPSIRADGRCYASNDFPVWNFYQ